MKKKAAYRCNSCMKFTCVTKSQLVAHVRKEHPEDGWHSCWDACEDLGDPFANAAMRTLQERLHSRVEQAEKKAAALEGKAKHYDELIPRYNAIIRSLNLIQLAIDTISPKEKTG